MAEGTPAVGACGGAELAGADAGSEEVGDVLGHDEELVEGDAAAVAFLVALDAAGAAGGLDGVGGDPERLGLLLAEVGGEVRIGLAAVGADPLGEALGDAADEGGPEEEGVDAHVQEAGDGADAVVRVEGREDEMPGLGGAHSDLRRFGIADFADEHDIGVVSEDRAEAAGEGEADLLARLDLDDAFELVLDRVFDGDDFAALVIGVGEGGIEGCGFAAAGGTGKEDEALGQLGEFADEGLLGGFEAELGEVEVEALAAEEAEADAFAVFGGDDGDPEVVVVLLGFHRDTAVVGYAFLRDIESGHDFEAGDEGGIDLAELGGDGDSLHDAVDAVAEFDGGVVGFEVDIGGLEAEGFGEDLIDEAGDAGVDGGLRIAGGDVEDDFLGGLMEAAVFAEALDGFGAEAEVAFDDGAEAAGGGEGRAELAVEQESEVADFGLTGRICEGEDEGFSVDADGEDAVMEHDGDGDHVLEVGRERVGGEIDEFDLVEGGEGSVGILFGSVIEGEDGGVLGNMPALLSAADGFELCGGQLALFEEEIPDFSLGGFRFHQLAGTSSVFLALNMRTLVWPALLVKVRERTAMAWTQWSATTLAPLVRMRRFSPRRT